MDKGERPSEQLSKKSQQPQYLQERLPCVPWMAGQGPASGMRGCSDRSKIQLRAAGFRLVVEVRDHSRAPSLVVAVGKQERNAGYRPAAQR